MGPVPRPKPATPHSARAPGGTGYGRRNITVSRAPIGSIAGRPGARRRRHEEIEDLDFPAAFERVREILDERDPLLYEFRAQVAAYGLEHPEWREQAPVAIPDPAVRDRIGEIPVAVVPDEARAGITPAPNTDSGVGRVVWLSPETALKQLKHEDETRRKPLRADHYRRLPEVIASGEWEAIGDRHLAFYHPIGGDWFRVIVKQTARNEVYLKTFHRCDRNRVPSKRRGANR